MYLPKTYGGKGGHRAVLHPLLVEWPQASDVLTLSAIASGMDACKSRWKHTHTHTHTHTPTHLLDLQKLITCPDDPITDTVTW